jgi:hypothetical protein
LADLLAASNQLLSGWLLALEAFPYGLEPRFFFFGSFDLRLPPTEFHGFSY